MWICRFASVRKNARACAYDTWVYIGNVNICGCVGGCVECANRCIDAYTHGTPCQERFNSQGSYRDTICESRMSYNMM